MNRSPLYKFLDPIGGKLTLGNGTFKHAKPSDFNDVEDLTISGVFPGSIADSLQEIEQNFATIIISNLECEPTCASPLREKLLAIQASIKANLSTKEILSDGLAQAEGEIYDVENMKLNTTSFVDEINEFLQSYTVLCVTRNVHSTRMWDEYEGKRGQACTTALSVHKHRPDPFSFLGIHHIYANRRALEGLTSDQFVDGSMFVFDQLSSDNAGNASVEGKRILIGVMLKDSNRFPQTGGWGYEAWAGESREQRLVNDGGASCHSCHTQQVDRGYVFSQWRE